MTTGARALEDLLRPLVPQVLGALTRRYGHFDTAEDAVQEALLAAFCQWPVDGVPADPRGWLIRVAGRRMVDALRSQQSRRRREEAEVDHQPGDRRVAPAADLVFVEHVADEDDSLVLLLLCCHPALAPASQVALTLRAVGGLTTVEIARAFLVPEPTMGQRISRAKAQIQQAGGRFALPDASERDARLDAVMQVLYLVFNEGHTATAGAALQRVDLTAEAIRLVRMLLALTPDDAEVAGLLALMLLTDARSAARSTVDGALVPLAEQDRGMWDQECIAEGVELVQDAMRREPLGPYQVQAAIGAVHAEARIAQDTDWAQVLGLYDLLLTLEDNPVAALNRVVAVAEVRGPEAGLHALEEVAGRLPTSHRVTAVRAHLLERVGRWAEAADAYRDAASGTTSLPEQRYLRARAARLC